MKKIINYLGLVIVLLSSCGDDDEAEASFIGTWIGTTRAVTECTDVFANSTQSLNCTDVNCYALVLSADGTFTFQQGTVNTSGTWSVGTVLSLCQDDEGEIICDEYRVEDNTATTLVLSTTNEGTNCKTSFSYERQENVDPDSGS